MICSSSMALVMVGERGLRTFWRVGLSFLTPADPHTLSVGVRMELDLNYCAALALEWVLVLIVKLR